MTNVLGKFTNSTSQTLAANGKVAFSSYSFNSPTIGFQNGNILLKTPGVYKITANFDLVATAADSDVAITLLEDGKETAGAKGTSTLTASGDYGNVAFSTLSTVKRALSGSYATVTFTSSAAVSVSNASVIIEKVE